MWEKCGTDYHLFMDDILVGEVSWWDNVYFAVLFDTIRSGKPYKAGTKILSFKSFQTEQAGKEFVEKRMREVLSGPDIQS